MLVLWVVVLILFFMYLNLRKRSNKLEKALKQVMEDLEVLSKQGMTAANQEAIVKVTEPTEAGKLNQVQPLQEQAVQEQAVEEHSTQVQAVQIEALQAQQVQVQVKKKRKAIFSKELLSVESIISKLGITLLLIGVGFIFKLAYDNGYITEELAVLIGAVIGFVLLGLGKRVKNKERRVLAQVLTGGGIATLYITTYAAYQGYGIIPGILAFIFMALVTAAGFIIAISEDSVSLSMIATLGGLLTPFIIQLEQLGLVGVGIYIFALAIGSMAVYVFKRWRLLEISNIVGTYFVTFILLGAGGLSHQAKGQFVSLTLVLFLLYSGLEYTLQYLDKASSRWSAVSYSLFITLPFITLAQVALALELSSTAWSIIYGVTALVYGLLLTLFFKKQGNSFISDIIISLMGFFGVFAVITYFDGEVEVIAILALGLLYFIMNRKLQGKVVAAIGHIIMAYGFILAIGMLFAGVYNSADQWIDFVIRVIVVLILVGGGLFHKKSVKWVYTSCGLLFYGLITVMIQCHWMVEDLPHLAVQIGVYGVYVLILSGLALKLELIPRLGVFVVAVLPFVIKLIMAVAAIISDESAMATVVALVLYGAFVYAMAHWLFRASGNLYLIGLKIVSFGIVFVTVLSDLTVSSEALAFGIIAALLVILFISYLEPDRALKGMVIFTHVLRAIWLVIVLGYFSIKGFEPELDVLLMLLHCLILVGVFHQTYSYKKNIKLLGVVVFNVILYMLVTYRTFEMMKSGDGTITLLWAAYAIILLTISVVKVEKVLVNVALGLIVLVAAKFVLIDLSSVSILWKIIVSMGFGSALLLLSYLLQPILNKEINK